MKWMQIIVGGIAGALIGYFVYAIAKHNIPFALGNIAGLVVIYGGIDR